MACCVSHCQYSCAGNLTSRLELIMVRKIKKIWKQTLAFFVAFFPFGQVQAAALDNPLRSEFDSIPKFITAVLDIAFLIIVPLIAVFLMYAGFLFVSAQGNEAQITKARNAFLWTVIGAAVALGAKILSLAIEGTINSLK